MIEPLPKAWTGGSQAVPNADLEIHEHGGEGNSAHVSLVFKGFDSTTGEDQTVHVYGEWERGALADALAWAVRELDR